MKLLYLTTAGFFLFAIEVIADSQVCQFQRVPSLVSFPDSRLSNLEDDLQVILPNYTFGCRGRVVQWGLCVVRETGDYDVEFQVWRPLSGDRYEMVGANFLEDESTINHCIIVNITSDQQILTEPEDVVGLFIDRSGRPRGGRSDGIQLNTSRTDLTIWYRRVGRTLEQQCPEIGSGMPYNCTLRIGENLDLNNEATGAAVVTAIVEPISATETISQGGDPISATETISQGGEPISDQGSSLSSGGIVGIVLALLVVVALLVAAFIFVFVWRVKHKRLLQMNYYNPSYEGITERFLQRPELELESIARSNPWTEAAGASRSPANENASSHYSYPTITIEDTELSDLPKNEGDYAYARLTSGEHDQRRHAIEPRYEVLYEATRPQGHSLDSQSFEMPHYEDPKLPSNRTKELDAVGMCVPTEVEWPGDEATLCFDRHSSQLMQEQRIVSQNHYEKCTEQNHQYSKLKFFVENQTYWAPASSTSGLYAQLAAKKYREIPRQQITSMELIGSGQFGHVYKGVWKISQASINVAVKILKSGADESARVTFLQEAAIMGQFFHHNVVHLYGVVTIGEPVNVVLEYMSGGDLRSHLRSLDLGHHPEHEGLQHQFLKFAREVAAGMTYLSGKSFVHRDLAARNILLDQNFMCKIGDFGLARDLMHKDHYTSKGGQFPVKWTAPEALFYKKYSPASDVWSYGMVLFEIWSLGRKPFQNLSNSNVLALIKDRHCQAPPPGCPKAVYNLMVDCWNPAFLERPTFADVGKYLRQPDKQLLAWAVEDIAASSKKARELGAPISESRHLYHDLQHKYKDTLDP